MEVNSICNFETANQVSFFSHDGPTTFAGALFTTLFLLQVKQKVSR